MAGCRAAVRRGDDQRREPHRDCRVRNRAGRAASVPASPASPRGPDRARVRAEGLRPHLHTPRSGNGAVRICGRHSWCRARRTWRHCRPACRESCAKRDHRRYRLRPPQSFLRTRRHRGSSRGDRVRRLRPHDCGMPPHLCKRHVHGYPTWRRLSTATPVKCSRSDASTPIDS